MLRPLGRGDSLCNEDLLDLSVHSGHIMPKYLKIFLILAFILITNHRFAEKIIVFSEVGEFVKLTFFLFIWVTFVLSVFFLANRKKGVIEIILIIIFVLSAIVGDAYYRATGNVIDLFALNELLISTGFLNNALKTYSNEIYISVIGGFLGFSLLLPGHFWRKQLDRRFKKLTRFFIFIPLLMVIVVIIKTGGYGTNGLPSQLTTFSLTIVNSFIQKKNIIGNHGYLPKPIELSKINNIIFIVDESIRGDYIDLNMNRGVTPFLYSKRHEIINFGLTASGSNCSAESNLILRYSAKKESIDSIGEYHSIWEYAKGAGYETTYIDCQLNYDKLNNYMTYDETKHIDNFISLFDGKDDSIKYRDNKTIPIINKILENGSKNFILIVKSGVHFPYDQTYPKDQIIFRPTITDEKSNDNKKAFINSYMNGVHWAVDSFFSNLLNVINFHDVLLVYTSDHGQNLRDKGLQPHCQSQDPAWQQGMVPLLVLTQQEELKEKFIHAANINFDHVSHFNIFPTFLELFGYGKKYLELYEPPLFAKIDSEQTFTSGLIFLYFGKKTFWNTFPKNKRQHLITHY